MTAESKIIYTKIDEARPAHILYFRFSRITPRGPVLH